MSIPASDFVTRRKAQRILEIYNAHAAGICDRLARFIAGLVMLNREAKLNEQLHEQLHEQESDR